MDEAFVEVSTDDLQGVVLQFYCNISMGEGKISMEVDWMKVELDYVTLANILRVSFVGATGLFNQEVGGRGDAGFDYPCHGG